MHLHSNMLKKLLDLKMILCFAGASRTDERSAIIMNSTLSCIIETKLDYYMFLGYFICVQIAGFHNN